METSSSDTNSDSELTVIGQNKPRLGMCEVCAVQKAKYTCPRCEVKTCCLKCSKIHKFELKCNGERDRTKYIPLNKFTNLDLHSDYCLLEEISRSLESSRKKFGRKSKFLNLPFHLQKLQCAAKSRNIELKFLPGKFARRSHNSTYLQSNPELIYWHIEWIFVNAENLKLSDEKVPETRKLASIVSKYFVPQDNETLAEKLQYYQSAGLSGVKFFLKAEQKSGNFYELDPSCNLKECLQKKMIIEYPIIHVVLKDHSCAYSVIDSDDEDLSKEKRKVKTGNEVVNSIIKNDTEGDQSSRNLLFASEYSDQDNSD